jgi:predicted outer membrane repeat protein
VPCEEEEKEALGKQLTPLSPQEEAEIGMRKGYVLLVVVAAAALVPGSARAATCNATDGASLTAQLADANCDPIILAPGLYTSAAGFTAPARSLSIIGPGASSATITRSGAGDVLTVPGGATLSISGVTLSGASNGSGLEVSGTGVASLTNSVISGNTSSSAGAGIAFAGLTLNITNSTISGNTTSADGGGVQNSSTLGTANLNGVLFSQNVSSGSGGAFDAAGVGTTNFRNATFTGNRADVDGGAIHSGLAGALTTLNNTTIAANVADDDDSGGGDGGGISNTDGAITIANSIVANNLATGGGAPDCDSAMASPLTRIGYELIRDPTGCTFGGLGDNSTGYVTGVNPLLGPLAGNGGTTQTMALLAGSPVVNAGNPDPPTATDGTCEVADQRGRPRSAAVLPCDLGAFEVQRVSCDTFSLTIGVGQATPLALECSGDPFVYQLQSAPSHGALSGFNALTGSVTYTPAAGFTGTDSFTYRGVNGPIASSLGTVTLRIPASAPPAQIPPGGNQSGFNLKKAIRKCKLKVPKGPKRTKCIKKAKKRARNS